MSSVHSRLNDLICDIEILIEKDHTLLKNVKNPGYLVECLAELNQLIGMESIKDSMIEQIKFIIFSSGSSDGHMLHTVIAGNPGVGKTTVAKVLAKIWMALGILKDPQQEFKLASKRKFNQTLVSLNNIRETGNKLSEEIDSPMLGLMMHDVESLIDDLDEPEPKRQKKEPKFVIASAKDMIAGYLGQTAPKTYEILKSAVGGVLFIDEAYNLVSSGKDDDFGSKCITEINEFMSNHPDEIIIIIAGYKDKLQQTLFTKQPGLMRRFTWYFEIEDYNIKELARIFKRQLKLKGWVIPDHIDIEVIFEKNKNIINFGGGGTEKLTFYVKTAYGAEKFKSVIDDITEADDKILSLGMIETGLSKLKRNEPTNAIEAPPEHMFT